MVQTVLACELDVVHLPTTCQPRPRTRREPMSPQCPATSHSPVSVPVLE